MQTNTYRYNFQKGKIGTRRSQQVKREWNPCKARNQEYLVRSWFPNCDHRHLGVLQGTSIWGKQWHMTSVRYSLILRHFTDSALDGIAFPRITSFLYTMISMGMKTRYCNKLGMQQGMSMAASYPRSSSEKTHILVIHRLDKNQSSFYFMQLFCFVLQNGCQSMGLTYSLNEFICLNK